MGRDVTHLLSVSKDLSRILIFLKNHLCFFGLNFFYCFCFIDFCPNYYYLFLSSLGILLLHVFLKLSSVPLTHEYKISQVF